MQSLYEPNHAHSFFQNPPTYLIILTPLRQPTELPRPTHKTYTTSPNSRCLPLSIADFFQYKTTPALYNHKLHPIVNRLKNRLSIKRLHYIFILPKYYT